MSVTEIEKNVSPEIIPAVPQCGSLEEEADECEWAAQFAASDDFLMQLVAEAREERRQGLLLPLETILDD